MNSQPVLHRIIGIFLAALIVAVVLWLGTTAALINAQPIAIMPTPAPTAPPVEQATIKGIGVMCSAPLTLLALGLLFLGLGKLRGK